MYQLGANSTRFGRIAPSELESGSTHIKALADVLAQPKADQFDLLTHIAFGKPIHMQGERADALVNYEQRFLENHSPEAKEVILVPLDKYRLAGVDEMANSEVLRLSAFREMGQTPEVIQRFGTIENLRQALNELQRRLYREDIA